MQVLMVLYSTEKLAYYDEFPKVVEPAEQNWTATSTAAGDFFQLIMLNTDIVVASLAFSDRYNKRNS